MISLLLFLTAIACFLFYGVAGQDKTWLLAPVYIISYAAVATGLLRQALGFRRSAAGDKAHGDELRTANCKLPIAALLWILFLLCGIAMIPQATIPFESKLRMLFIGGVVGSYLVWGSELTTFKDNRILLGVLIFVVMLTALYGLVVHFKYPDWLLWTERYAVYEGRLTSTYICPNHFAHLMQMLLPFCLALLFIPQAGLYLRMLSAYSFLAFLPPLFLTESRAGWLGSIAATGVVLCLMALRRSKRLFLVLMVLIPLCSFLLLFAGWKYSETFQRRAKPVMEFLRHQNEEGVGSEAKDFRPQTWMDTIDMIREAPLIGFGPGNYRYTYPEYRKRFQGKRIVTGHPHNEYLELTADFGLVGFGLFALAWIYGLIRILIASFKSQETRHAFIGFAFLGAAAGTMVHSFFDFQMHVYPNAAVFAFLAALACGPLAVQRAKAGRYSGQKTENGGQRSEGGRQRTGDGGQQGGNGTGRSASGDQRASDLSAVGADLLAIADTANHQLPTSNMLRQAGTWLLAAGYFVAAVFCLQIMSSAYIRALGDRAVSETDDFGAAAERLYTLAVKIDPQNWRAYKGMGNLMFGNRYYSLERDEKIILAGQERSWHEKAYEHNPKDPEICLAYGKCLIFLGKNQGSRHSASGTGVDEETAAGRSDGGKASSPSTDIGDDVPPDSDLKSIGQQPLAISQKQSEESKPHAEEPDILKPNTTNLTPVQQIERGIDLLREACRYRPFNDGYWWNLGVELRNTGRYAEALEVFRRAASINRTRSTKMNIEWLLDRIKTLNESGGDLPLQAETSKMNTREPLLIESTAPGLILDVPDIAADPGLKDLLDRMGE
jgi:O-antigen ligase/tetratricopeptide (TPR) repeat protein